MSVFAGRQGLFTSTKSTVKRAFRHGCVLAVLRNSDSTRLQIAINNDVLLKFIENNDYNTCDVTLLYDSR